MTSVRKEHSIIANATDSLVVSIGDKRNDLVAAECQSLSGVLPVNGIAMGGRTDLIHRSAYQRYGIKVLAQANSFTALCERTARLTIDLNEFHVLTLAPGTSAAGRRSMIVDISNAIQWDPNLENPRHRLAMIQHAGLFALGSITIESDKSYLQHDKKPHRTSSSLPARLARGLLNILPLNTSSILDPCCGSGSIPLEAMVLGLKVYCGDRKPRMAHMTRANLSHFDYHNVVEVRDARDWTQTVDAIVTDLPHGRYSHVQDEVILGILQQATRLAPVAIVVAGSDITLTMKEAGFSTIEVFRVPKQAGFARFVHRAWVN